ncbi:MAG: PD-(D/E)XK nuclease superfamily protein [Dehalococcoidia bacterium]
MAGGTGTSTGAVLEAMVLPALEHGGYAVERQVHVGGRLGGGKQLVDIVARSGPDVFLVSMKWQQVSGTAEQKVPFEAMCLADVVRRSATEYRKAYIVLGGPGWKLREFFVNGGLADHLTHADMIDIVALETFVAKANAGAL